MQKKFCFLLFLLITSLAKISISQTRLYFIVNQGNAIVRMDSSLIRQREMLTVTPGNHTIKVWAPHCELKIINYTFKKDSLNMYKVRLSTLPEYKKYKKELFKFNMATKGTFFLALGSIVSCTVQHLFLTKKTDQAMTNAQNEKDLHDNSINLEDLFYHRVQYEMYKEKYDTYRARDKNLLIASAVIIPVTTAAFIYFKVKLKKPTYHEETLLSKFDLQLNNLNYATLTYHF